MHYSRISAALALVLVVVAGCSDPDDNNATSDTGQTQADAGDAGDAGDAVDDGGSDADAATDGCDTSQLTEITPDQVVDGGVIAKGCYVVNEKLAVNGGTLEIEAGAEIYFSEGTQLSAYSDGRLKAVGTADEPILMTALDAETPAYWNGVLYSSSIGADNRLEHVIIEYGGNDELACGAANLNAQSAGLVVANTTLRHSKGKGFCFVDGVEISEFTDNVVADNAGVTGLVDGVNLTMFPSGDATANELSSNGEDFIDVRGGNYDADIGSDSDYGDGVISAISVPYRVLNRVTVNEADVVIEAGVEMQFEEGNSFYVGSSGSLSAEGTEDAPILLTSVDTDTPKYWKGLRFEGSISSDNLLEHTTVEYAGSEGFECAAANVSVDQAGGQNSTLSIRNSILRNGKGFGLCSLDGADLTVRGSTLTGNESGPALIDGYNMTRAFPTDAAEANDFSGNTHDYVFVRGGNYDAELGHGEATTATLPVLNVPYRLRARVKVDDGTVEVQPGVTLAMQENVPFYVGNQGALNAIGTEQDPITFTSADTSTPKYWNHLQFEGSNSADNVLEHVVIEYSGKGAPDDWNGNLFLSQEAGVDPVVELRNSTISNSQTYGIFLYEGTINDCGNVTFESNAAGDIGQDPGGSVTVACP